eukprot:1180373-Prorocentrum_minimum.AAC.1
MAELRARLDRLNGTSSNITSEMLMVLPFVRTIQAKLDEEETFQGMGVITGANDEHVSRGGTFSLTGINRKIASTCRVKKSAH